MPRLFTALEIPPEVGQSLAMLRGGLPGARWIEPENYHLTLRFIGDIDDAMARDVASLLGHGAQDGVQPAISTVLRPSAAGGRAPWWRRRRRSRP